MGNRAIVVVGVLGGVTALGIAAAVLMPRIAGSAADTEAAAAVHEAVVEAVGTHASVDFTSENFFGEPVCWISVDFATPAPADTWVDVVEAARDAAARRPADCSLRVAGPRDDEADDVVVLSTASAAAFPAQSLDEAVRASVGSGWEARLSVVEGEPVTTFAVVEHFDPTVHAPATVLARLREHAPRVPDAAYEARMIRDDGSPSRLREVQVAYDAASYDRAKARLVTALDFLASPAVGGYHAAVFVSPSGAEVRVFEPVDGSTDGENRTWDQLAAGERERLADAVDEWRDRLQAASIEVFAFGRRLS